MTRTATITRRIAIAAAAAAIPACIALTTAPGSGAAGAQRAANNPPSVELLSTYTPQGTVANTQYAPQMMRVDQARAEF